MVRSLSTQKSFRVRYRKYNGYAGVAESAVLYPSQWGTIQLYEIIVYIIRIVSWKIVTCFKFLHTVWKVATCLIESMSHEILLNANFSAGK